MDSRNSEKWHEEPCSGVSTSDVSGRMGEGGEWEGT